MPTLILSVDKIANRITAPRERFEQNVSWSLGALNDDERERLYHWYQQQDARALAPASRDWALIWWIAYRKRHCDDFPFSGTNRCVTSGRYRGGDLTTRALNIGHQHGYIEFFHRQGGCVSGISVACKMLTTLGLTIDNAVSDGSQANAGQRLIRAQGNAAALHQGWKAVQNVLEWSCGVSDYLAQMLALLRERYPDGNIACTRKAIPGTRLLASQAILAAGGLIHRAGCAETILLFANHRHFLHDNQDWSGAINQLRRHAPEKKIVVEADTPKEAIAALRAQPDVLQLDKFNPQQATEIAQIAPSLAPHCTLALTGGINLTTLKNYLDCGIRLFITSAPYYATPADIKVSLQPAVSI